MSKSAVCMPHDLWMKNHRGYGGDVVVHHQQTLLICFNDVVVICRERRKHFVTVNGNQVPQLRELARYNLIDMSIKLDDDDVSHAILSSTGLGPSSVHVVFNNGSDCVKWVGIMHDNQLVLQKDKRLGVKAR